MSTIVQRSLLVPIQGSAARAHNKGLARSPSSHTAMVLGCIQESLSIKIQTNSWTGQRLVERRNFRLFRYSRNRKLSLAVQLFARHIASEWCRQGLLEPCSICPQPWRYGILWHPMLRCVCVGMQALKTAFFMPGKENILTLPQVCSYDFRSSCLGIGSAALGLPILLSEKYLLPTQSPNIELLDIANPTPNHAACNSPKW